MELLRDICSYLLGERAGKVFGLTFDDGYLNNLTHALPVLRRHDFSSTCYAVSQQLGKTNEWDSALLTAGATRFTIDAAQLRFVDSMGLGALIYLRRMARQGKGDVLIASAGRELLEILDISGLGQMFEVLPDVAAAAARFSLPEAQ